MRHLLHLISQAIGRMPDWFYFTSLTIMLGTLLAVIMVLLAR